MSLQIWLPLNGDLKNNGIKYYDITTLGTVSWPTEGKIGKCFQGGDGTQVANGISLNSNLTNILSNDYSIAVWIKPLGTHVHYNGAIISSGNWNRKTWSFGVSQDNTKVDVLSNRYNIYINCPIPVNVWTHLVCIRKNNVIKLYKNGEYIDSLNGAVPSAALQSDADNTTIGRQTYADGYFSFNGCINDLRIYDNALSQQQIKKISKGLILHYPLNRQCWGQDNILSNTHFDTQYSQTTGWDTNKNGILLASAWGGYNSGVSNQATVYHAHLKNFNSEYVYEFIKTNNETWLGIAQGKLQTKMIEGKIYTFSWEEYHVEGTNRVGTGLYYYKTGASSANFHLGIQQASNITRVLNKWQKFSYTFTAPTDADWSKSMIWYIYGHYNNNGTFYFRHPKLEEGSKATPWCPNAADDIYTTLGLGNNIQYDISGYQNNGTKHNITYDSDPPKYDVSSVFTGADTSYIKVNENNWVPQYQEAMTINLWAYSLNWASTTKLFSCTQSGGWNTEAGTYGYIRFPIYVATNQARTSHEYKYNSQELKILNLSAGWHMLTFIYDSTGNKVYVDGQLHSSYAFTSYGIKYNTNARLFLGCEAYFTSPSTPYLNGKISDFRLYATALSAEDILSLYNNEAEIDEFEVDSSFSDIVGEGLVGYMILKQ